MHLLGRLRAEEAMPELLRRITFVSIVHETKSRIVIAYLWGTHPAVNTLISIGMPSVVAIMKTLPQEINALRRKLMVRVLVGVEGSAVTRFRLKRAISKAANAKMKANLHAALRDIPTSAH